MLLWYNYVRISRNILEVFMEQIGVLKFRDNISHILENLQNDHEMATITKNGKPLAVVMNFDDYRSIIETLYLLGNSANNQAIDNALLQLERNRLHTGKMIDV